MTSIARGAGLLLALAVWPACGARQNSPPETSPPETSPPENRPRNLLLFTLDTTRADHLGCYGNQAAQTATIDALARRGVLFEQARTCAPLTLPSHTTILTGLLPCEHGVRDNGLFRIGAETPTLARTLAAGGYATGAFVGAFVLDSSFGLDGGFDVYRDVKSKSVISGGFYEERPATAVTADAVAWLEQRPRDRPFFAWVHYFDAHAPYQSPIARPGLSPYDAEIAFVSEQMQVLLDRLGEALADTLVVITADHGEGLGEHGEDSHGYLIYESTMHVPLIFAHRSLAPQGGRVAASVGLQDIARTVCDLLGVTPDPAFGGRSLAPALRGETIAGAPQYLENYSTYYSHGWSPLLGWVVTDGAKLIKAPRSELYRLSQDPQELHDAIGEEPDLASRLRSGLDEELLSHPPRAGASSEIAVNAATRDKLQALGYVGGRPRPAAGTELPDPKDKMAIVRKHDRAASLMREGRLQQAIAIMTELVDQDPSNPQFLSHYGSLLGMVGQWPEAIAVLERAVAAGEQSAATSFNLAEAHARLDHQDRTEAYLRLTIAQQPRHVGALLKLAELLEKKGAVEEARSQYEALLQSWEGEESFRASLRRRLEYLSKAK